MHHRAIQYRMALEYKDLKEVRTMIVERSPISPRPLRIARCFQAGPYLS